MARFGQGTTWSDLCFRRMNLDALLRKDSRWPRVEVRRSVRAISTMEMQMMVIWTKAVVVEVVTNSWILDTFWNLCQCDFTREQMQSSMRESEESSIYAPGRVKLPPTEMGKNWEEQISEA